MGCWDIHSSQFGYWDITSDILTGGKIGDINEDINGMLMEYWLIPSMCFFNVAMEAIASMIYRFEH